MSDMPKDIQTPYKPFTKSDQYYKVFICNGIPGTSSYNATGPYSTRGDDSIDAALEFSRQWDRNSAVPKYGIRWTPLKADYEGLPQNSFYVGDEKGNRLLLVLNNAETNYAKRNFVTTLEQFIIEKKKLEKNADLMIVDVQDSFSKYFSNKYVEELEKYCKEFNRVYQVWDNTSQDLEAPSYDFPNEVGAYVKEYGFDLYDEEEISMYFMPAVAQKIISEEYSQGDGFEMKDGRVAIYVGAQHSWFLVEEELASLFKTLKSQGRKLIMVGGAGSSTGSSETSGECLTDVYQAAKYFGIDVEINEGYVYTSKGSPFNENLNSLLHIPKSSFDG